MEQTRYLMDNLILKKNQSVPPNPVRRWLRDGGVKMLSTKHKNKLKRRWIILFSDVLLLTEREEKKEKGQADEKKKVLINVALLSCLPFVVYVMYVLSRYFGILFTLSANRKRRAPTAGNRPSP